MTFYFYLGAHDFPCETTSTSPSFPPLRGGEDGSRFAWKSCAPKLGKDGGIVSRRSCEPKQEEVGWELLRVRKNKTSFFQTFFVNNFLMNNERRLKLVGSWTESWPSPVRSATLSMRELTSIVLYPISGSRCWLRVLTVPRTVR